LILYLKTIILDLILIYKRYSLLHEYIKIQINFSQNQFYEFSSFKINFDQKEPNIISYSSFSIQTHELRMKLVN